MYSYGIKNAYRPTSLIPNAFGWSTRPQYNRADVPTGLMTRPTDLTDDQFRQQFAYEWFQSSQLGGDRNLTNPPFTSGASGRLHPALRDSETGMPARILRGYIRRAEFSAGEPLSKARLYFMYNPEQITRDYVSYLNQSALDPFNTVYESGNLVAPPSILDFSFSLFFDRQEEACQADHPGVFVDYQYFDLVVRNVVPQDPNQSGNTLPDNGVMMVNPRDITVVFSPQLTVQGRPLNAQVNFEKFTHRMTPTRMTIQLQMRAVYLGPVKDQVEYKKEELQAEAAIPFGDVLPDYGLTFEKSEDDTDNWWTNLDNTDMSYEAIQKINEQYKVAGDANHQARLAALAWAQAHPDASDDPSYFVTEAYIQTGNGSEMEWMSHPGVSDIVGLAKKNTHKQMYIPIRPLDIDTDLMSGDLLIGTGHIGFFIGYASNGDGRMFSAKLGEHAMRVVGDQHGGGTAGITHLLRPMPVGSTTPLANSGVNVAINTGQFSDVGATSGALDREQVVSAPTGLKTNASPDPILLSPAAAPAFAAWRAAWGGPIPCTTGWRSKTVQAAGYAANPGRFAHPDKSWHCKGLAVDVDGNWLGALSDSERSQLRIAAFQTGWGQARWRKSEGSVPGYEAPCNPQKGTRTDEAWHFSWGGCG